MLNKLSIDYYNYINVFNKSQTNILFLYRSYNHKLKFIEKINKNTLSKNRIYSISKYKFEQIKKYLNEHLKKNSSYRIMLYSHRRFYLLKNQIKNYDFVSIIKN